MEKLKAWKKLKDMGFKFRRYQRDARFSGEITIYATDDTDATTPYLNMLFGGEE